VLSDVIRINMLVFMSLPYLLLMVISHDVHEFVKG